MSAAISIIDYGAGNIQSVRGALQFLGQEHEVISSPEEVARAERLLLPGVGAFRAAMDRLRELGLVDAIRDAVLSNNTPILGICLGMQLLAEEGEEGGRTEGLGLIPGKVIRLEPASPEEKLPHVGFNEVSITDAAAPIWNGINDRSPFYFVHSYHLSPRTESVVAGWCQHGERFAAAVHSGGVFGTQFHPEKSQNNGLRLLRNFLAGAR